MPGDIIFKWRTATYGLPRTRAKATHSTHKESSVGSASGIREEDKEIGAGSNTGARRLQEQTMTVRGIHDRDRPQGALHAVVNITDCSQPLHTLLRGFTAKDCI
jgi:hypothetical protein